MPSAEASAHTRVLIAKPGLDGHDRGARIVAAALRDAGMEVIYAGLHLTPEEIVSAALQEDVDVIGISILSGAHRVICRRVMELLKQANMSDIPIFVGGIITPKDVQYLKQLGVKEVFLPGTSLRVIVEQTKKQATRERPRLAS
jgi:methylmalonyl-CoA mutase C-terminal domain/subunit